LHGQTESGSFWAQEKSWAGERWNGGTSTHCKAERTGSNRRERKGKIDPGENLLCGDESVRNRGNRYDPGGGKTGPLLRTDPFLSESPAHLTRGRRETARSAAITRDTTGPIYSTRNGKNKKKQKGTQLRAWKKGKRV
jgi:hypothetical protein